MVLDRIGIFPVYVNFNLFLITERRFFYLFSFLVQQGLFAAADDGFKVGGGQVFCGLPAQNVQTLIDLFFILWVVGR